MSDVKRPVTDWTRYYCSNQKVVVLTDANEYAISFAVYTNNLEAENKRLRANVRRWWKEARRQASCWRDLDDAYDEVMWKQMQLRAALLAYFTAAEFENVDEMLSRFTEENATKVGLVVAERTKQLTGTITHIEAERDTLQGELKEANRHSDELFRAGVARRKEADTLQAQLTKARRLLRQLMIHLRENSIERLRIEAFLNPPKET